MNQHSLDIPQTGSAGTGKLLLRRPPVNQDACLAAEARCKGLLDPSPQANPGCSRVAGRSRRMVLPSAAARITRWLVAGLAATVRSEGQDAGGGDHGTRQGRRPRPAQGGSAGESKRERPGRAVEKDTEQGRDVTIVDIDPWGAFFEDFWGQAEGEGADRPDGGREPARDARAKGVEGFHPYDLVQANSPEEWQALHDLRRTELFARMEGVAYDADHPDDRAPIHFPLVLKFRDRHIGTARLDLFENGGAAIRLVAIAREEQRKGHGRVLEQLLEELARSKGVSKLFVNAHPTAVGYYERLGFIHEEWREPGGVRSSIAKDCVLMTKVI